MPLCPEPPDNSVGAQMLEALFRCVPEHFRSNVSHAKEAITESISSIRGPSKLIENDDFFREDYPDLGSAVDQSEGIAYHTQKGIEFLDKYSSFLKERCSIEAEYSKQLRALVKKYSPKKKEEEEPFTYARAFTGVLGELGDIAGQHEVVVDSVREKILRDIAATSRDLKEQRKTHLSEAARLNQQLDAGLDHMWKMRREYCKAFKEAEAAQLKYQKAEANMDLSRAELEKARSNSISRTQQQEEAKSSYALQLQKTNEMQRQHYQETLPNVFEKLRTMDESRIAYIQRLIRQCVEAERGVLPIIQKCLDGMIACADSIEPPKDTRLVVERYRTGYLPPNDIPFEDLGPPLGGGGSHHTLDGGPYQVPNGVNNGHAPPRRPAPPNVNVPDHPGAASSNNSRKSGRLPRTPSSKHGGTLKSLFGRHKTEELKEDFSDLPPAQRIVKLGHKVEKLEKELETKTASRDGLQKMIQCYTENPKLGDLTKVQEQLTQTNRELDVVQGELAKFQKYYSEAESQMNVPINASWAPSPQPSSRSPSHRGSVTSSSHASTPTNAGVAGGPSVAKPERSSLSEESISSESSMGHRQKSPQRFSNPPPPSAAQPPTPAPNHGSSASPESGIGGENSMLSYADQEGDFYENYNEPDAQPVLGQATALYTFDGGSDGTIVITDGESLLLLEKDEGDGWTKIRKLNSGEEGFVPTSYLDCKWYPAG